MSELFNPSPDDAAIIETVIETTGGWFGGLDEHDLEDAAAEISAALYHQGLLRWGPSCSDDPSAQTDFLNLGVHEASVALSGEDFDFIYGAFEKLMSPYSTAAEIEEVTRLENQIWAILQRIGLRPAKDRNIL